MNENDFEFWQGLAQTLRSQCFHIRFPRAYIREVHHAHNCQCQHQQSVFRPSRQCDAKLHEAGSREVQFLSHGRHIELGARLIVKMSLMNEHQNSKRA
jgi:hypothetical protein